MKILNSKERLARWLVAAGKLFSEVQRIEFKIKFDNRVCDHRLQVGFPTTIKIDQVYAEGHFDVVK